MVAKIRSIKYSTTSSSCAPIASTMIWLCLFNEFVFLLVVVVGGGVCDCIEIAYLCWISCHRYLLEDAHDISIKKQIEMFLLTVGHYKHNHVTQHMFQHSQICKSCPKYTLLDGESTSSI